MAKRSRSSVWNYFKKIEDSEYATCMVGDCSTKIKQAHGNTSNLLKHLKTKHSKEHEECAAQIAAEKKKRGEPKEVQLTLTQSIEQSQYYPKESAKKAKIDDALIKMIATDLQPVSVVEDRGFKEFVHTLDKRYEVPSRRTVMKRLPETYQNLRSKIMSELATVEHVAITTDIWTSLQTKAYCCMTIHYISKDWELKTSVIETFEFPEAHTGDNIASELERVTTDWQITDKVVCVVTDNASNMVSAIGKTAWRHLPCFAHSLNLVVQDSIKRDSDVSSLQQRSKDIVSHFHRSVKSSEKLKEVQKQLNVSDHKLVQEVSTRWNSTYLMFTRIHEQFEAITTALCLLGQNHLCLKNEDKELISNCLIVLKPFLEATENISGDKYVSVSMIIPLVKLLLESMKSHLSTLPLAANISAELASRFSSIEGAYVTAATTLLDPRFKKLPFSSPTASDFAVSRIRNEVARLIPSETTEATENSSEACTQSLWDSFDKQAVESTAHRTAGTEAIIEVRRYFEEPIIPRSSNPLLWWKENQHRFPRLMQIAKKYLCIPGSSVPSERLFSKAGQLVSERRNRLKPKNIDLLLFLNNNL